MTGDGEHGDVFNSRDEKFDLDEVLASRIPSDSVSGEVVHQQALAVLIDSDLTTSQREVAFLSMMTARLEELGPEESDRFLRIAATEGEVAAMQFLSGFD